MKLVGYLEGITGTIKVYTEGGAAVHGVKMNREQVHTLFDIIQKKFLMPMGIKKENEEYAKIGSWSATHEFPNDKLYGDIDILINLKDKDFAAQAQLIKTLYENFASKYPSYEFPPIKINKGTNVVSIGLPVSDTEFGQVDFFLTKNFDAIKVGYIHTEQSKIKGKFKMVAINSLMKLINPDFRWSPAAGLKTSDGYVTDVNKISKLVGFDFSTMTSMTNVWNKIKELATPQQLEDIKIDLRKLGINDVEVQQFDDMVK